MRTKTLKLIITFHTTSQAIAAERFFHEHEIPGRLIPVPREITAGCGMAWAVPAEEEEKMRAVMEEYSVSWEGCHILMI